MTSLPNHLAHHLESALERCKFTEADRKAIRREATECWYLHVIQKGEQALGRSKMGGLPDLPNDTPWPRGQCGALSFIMQIRLDDIDVALPFGMPRQGMLYFFVGDDELAKNVEHKLIWTADSSKLQRTMQPPLAEMSPDYVRSGELIPHSIEIIYGVDVPIWGFPGKLEIDSKDDAVELMTQFEAQLRGTSEREVVAGKLFGFQPGVHSIREEIALLSLDSSESAPLAELGHDVWDRLSKAREKYSISYHQVQEAMSQWCQILWIDSNFRVGFNIWDAGSYSVMIGQDDIASRDFDKSHTMLETC
jgi:uncharacterized protein YwqG